MIFAWIEERRPEFPVAMMCRVLGVSRAGYYAWRTRLPSAAATRREDLVEAIRAIHAEPRKDTYGRPRVTRDLHARGIAVCENTVAGVIAHSDRGSQYASDHFQVELSRHEMVGSMSGVGQCWDNAVIESPFGRMKVELTHGEQYTTRDEAKASIFEDIEVFYNRVRRHSTLEYMTPDEFERTHNPDIR